MVIDELYRITGGVYQYNDLTGLGSIAKTLSRYRWSSHHWACNYILLLMYALTTAYISGAGAFIYPILLDWP